MKLNLLMYSDNIMAGYTNIDPYPVVNNKNQEFSTEKQMGDVQNLDNIADDGECDEVRAIDVLDYVNIEKKLEVIGNWMKKVKHGGTLTIGGVNLYGVALAIKTGQIVGDEARKVLYGPPSFPFGSRRGLYSIDEIVGLLRNNGFNVIQQNLSNNRYTVVAQRP